MKKENEMMKEVYKAPFVEMLEVKVERGFENSPTEGPEAPGPTDSNNFTW